MKRKYREIYFTDHALERIRERGIKQGDVYATWNRPEKSKFSKKKGAWVYTRKIGGNELEVVATKNPSTGLRRGQSSRSGQVGKWVVISVWSKPVSTEKVKKKSVFKAFIANIFGIKILF